VGQAARKETKMRTEIKTEKKELGFPEKGFGFSQFFTKTNLRKSEETTPKTSKHKPGKAQKKKNFKKLLHNFKKKKKKFIK